MDIKTSREVNLRHWYGGQDPVTSPSDLVTLLAELEEADQEHPDVSVEDDQGWGISAYRGFRLVLENVEDPSVRPRHLRGLSAAEALRALELFVANDWPSLLGLPWSDTADVP